MKNFMLILQLQQIQKLSHLIFQALLATDLPPRPLPAVLLLDNSGIHQMEPNKRKNQGSPRHLAQSSLGERQEPLRAHLRKAEHGRPNRNRRQKRSPNRSVQIRTTAAAIRQLLLLLDNLHIPLLRLDLEFRGFSWEQLSRFYIDVFGGDTRVFRLLFRR